MSFPNNNELKMHLMSEHGNSNSDVNYTNTLSQALYKCNQCGTSLPNNNELQKHIKTKQHQTKQHKKLCEICGTKFSNDNDITTHIENVHRNNKETNHIK